MATFRERAHLPARFLCIIGRKMNENLSGCCSWYSVLFACGHFQFLSFVSLQMDCCDGWSCEVTYAILSKELSSVSNVKFQGIYILIFVITCPLNTLHWAIHAFGRCKNMSVVLVFHGQLDFSALGMTILRLQDSICRQWEITSLHCDFWK